MTRSNGRNVWHIDVSNIPKSVADAQIKKVVGRYRSHKILTIRGYDKILWIFKWRKVEYARIKTPDDIISKMWKAYQVMDVVEEVEEQQWLPTLVATELIDL